MWESKWEGQIKEIYGKIYLTLWGATLYLCICSVFQLYLGAYLWCLSLVFCLMASLRIQGLPFDLQERKVVWGGSGERQKGWGYPTVPKVRENPLVSFSFFSPVLERERLWPSGCSGYYDVNALLRLFIASLGSTVHTSTGHQKTCELVMFTCKSRNALLIGIWSLQIKFKKKNCKSIIVWFLKQNLMSFNTEIPWNSDVPFVQVFSFYLEILIRNNPWPYCTSISQSCPAEFSSNTN